MVPLNSASEDILAYPSVYFDLIGVQVILWRFSPVGKWQKSPPRTWHWCQACIGPAGLLQASSVLWGAPRGAPHRESPSWRATRWWMTSSWLLTLNPTINPLFIESRLWTQCWTKTARSWYGSGMNVLDFHTINMAMGNIFYEWGNLISISYSDRAIRISSKLKKIDSETWER